MSQTVEINGVTYNNVPQVEIPLAGGGGNAVFYDTSAATVTASDVLSGVVAFGSSGSVTGSITPKSGTDLSISGNVVTVPAGYYSTPATGTVPTATQATPAVSINTSTGLITASATQTAGYVSAGTASDTLQLTVQAAQTITPGTSNKTIAANVYTTGVQTVLGDPDLISSNIKAGCNIFGVAGATNVVDTTVSTSAASASTIMNGYKAYVNGSLITGNATVPTVSQDSGTKILTIS